jgi:hypothetical protein
MTRPFFQFMVGGNDVTPAIKAGGISLEIREVVGENADSATITIDDPDGIVAPPPRGVEMRIIAGYEDEFRDFGIFIVDQTSLKGWPQTITISAQSAGAKEATKQRRQQSYKPPQYSTYQDVFSEIASRNDLELALSSDIGSKALEYEAQSEESDIAFLARITEKFDAHVSIKDRRLVGVVRGEGKSVSGMELPVIHISKGTNILSYGCSDMDKPKHKKSKSAWFDRQKVKMVIEEADATDEGPDYLGQDTQKSQAEAQAVSSSSGKKLKRGSGSASFVIEGTPHARAEAIVLVTGVRSLINGRWRAKGISHSWSSSGPYTTSIECELPS